MVLVRHAQSRPELVCLLVDVFSDERVRQGIRAGKDRFSQGTQERIGTAAYHDADHLAALFQAARVGIADKMAVPDDLFDLFAGRFIHVGTVVQDAADSSYGNAGDRGDILDRINFHIHTPMF